MTDTSPLLSLPYIQAAQAQKHITHNEAIELLDAVTQISLEALDATMPPASAAKGQAWAIAAGATGVWAGHIGKIAAWRGGGWLFVTPNVGWVAWDKTTGTLNVWTNTGWAVQGGTPDFDNLAGVGINAASDATNKLAVAADATLLSHDGAGHQLKLNKASISDTASLLYQTNWSGRAEMGLAGNDDFAIKVSADGSTFTEALRIDATTGAVSLHETGSRQIMPLNYRSSMFTDLRWVAPTSNSAGLNATLSLGTGAEPNVDWDGKGTFLPAVTVISSLTIAGNVSSAEVTDIDLRVHFQYGPWGVGWNDNTSTTRVALLNADDTGLIAGIGMNKGTYTLNYTTSADGYFSMAIKPSAAAVLTTTRYYFVTGLLDITLPA